MEVFVLGYFGIEKIARYENYSLRHQNREFIFDWGFWDFEIGGFEHS